MKSKKNILLLVEGAKTDVRLMQKIIATFKLDIQYNIVSYNTNIYTLYDKMFKKENPVYMDLLGVLRENEKDTDKKHQNLKLFLYNNALHGISL